MSDVQAPALSDEAMAAIKLLQRNGMRSFELRFSPPEDDTPGDTPGRVAWLAIANFADRWEVAAARKPNRAVLRLATAVVDGAVCTHCSKVCGFDEDYTNQEINEAVSAFVCWFVYDPENKVFRRSCE